ncbi:MAG: prepilin-type N-terminal cleavage/methylation domain-containing protein [Candidatus Marinimicrobia bacterium]|jgi:prepilin-type N-terminal cleavage/methylation domain-containing protein|nr:prepilin-type N-terminal cleavage/methylation domain-containing protein [Candidatus Neomarinimicrobiota bacterium]MBT3502367.1 prepilin-type N-terminal cleavage/methylation domain-containing protein [Candidatus Neomarinimicrobiota bacterium]MBT3839347.1 prepilin-type N-terminal cleavage/methylation domain-containing protein [Candidatus Neomarinimicrobiota bacterium]MBT4000413.1 prepilin-type N-terminal cleavage/methylation domain-containing protein [Candidatus Neomarinimicrobiota bacterium]M
MKLKLKRSSKSGFTMIEIMVVVVIVAILAMIALPTYFDLVKGGYASEARTVMSNVHNASKMYYQIKGSWPSEIDELERSGQLDIDQSTKLKWSFDLQLNDQGGRITATSTEEMSGGAGHQVVFDADLGKFLGYGSPDNE